MNKSSLAIFFATLMALAFSTTLMAQLELEQTIPGVPTRDFIFEIHGFNFPDRLDFNGDGVAEISLFKTDPQGNVLLAIQDGADPSNRWWLPEPDDEVVLDFKKATVIGYSELDGDKDFKEIILAQKKGQRFVNPIVMDITGAVIMDGTSNTLLGIMQMDGDICEEIVLSNPDVPQIEVYGKQDSPSTSVQWQAK